MVRKLLVELERLWACYDDGSQRPIDEQALLLGTVVSSRYIIKQESPAVSGSVQNLTISAWWDVVEYLG
jgi:hypothetical protein